MLTDPALSRMELSVLRYLSDLSPKGSALMQDLTDAGASVVSDKVPNSGTFDRLALGAGALGSGALSPAKMKRFKHNDLVHLKSLIDEESNHS